MKNQRSKSFDKPTWSLSRLVQVLPGMPRHLVRAIPTFMGKPFGNAFREWIMVAVAVENQSWSCQFAHTAFGRLSGLSEDQVQALLARHHDMLSPSERAVMEFVRDLVQRDFVSHDAQLYQRLGNYYPAEMCATILATAHTMNFFNRFGNTFDAACAELLYGRHPSGLKTLDRWAIATLFLGGALPMLPMLAVLRFMQTR